jgi:hypothetical protein
VLLDTTTPAPRGAVLPPALAAAKARGVRSRRTCDAPERPPITAVPAPPSAAEFCALLDAAARARGATFGVDFRRYSSCRALLATLHSLARTRQRGRAVSGTVRSSWGYLAKLVDELLDWQQKPDHDHYDNAERRRSSLRRWLRELQAAGLLRATIVCDDEGQERGVDIELLAVPAADADALARAADRLARWRRRYGDGPQLAERRSGAILARLEQRRRKTKARFAGRRSHPPSFLDTSGPPLKGAVGAVVGSSKASDLCEGSCGARARAQKPQQTRSQAPASASPLTASSALTAAGEDGEREALLRARWALWEQQIAAAIAVCSAFEATVQDPLPDLGALRLALAAHCQGVIALSHDEPVAGLSPRLLGRLRRAATAWMRWRPSGAPDAAGELLRRAELDPGAELGELVRAFVVAAHRQARQARARQPARLDAAHRRADRQQQAILDAWPDWLQRAGDRLVLDPGERFLQVKRLPTAAELNNPALRRWLRAITALQWFAPASAVELTDPDGRYAYIPLVAGALERDDERTRGPWTSDQPRRRAAQDRARHAIRARNDRHHDH